MKKAPRPSKVPVAGPIRLSGPSARLRRLSEEHDQLLRDIGRKRAELSRFEDAVRAALARVADQMTPLADEAQRLDDAVHEMFAALAASKRRSARERKQIARVCLDLQKQGVLSARNLPSPGGDSDDDDWAEPETESAAKPTDPGAIRALFRRLVEALHPDKVQDEALKATRTEVMKQITVAYGNGDFARLLEIERTWATAPPDVSDDHASAERRLAALEQANEELRQQLRDLGRQLRRLKASEEGHLARALKRGNPAAQLDDMVGPIQDQLEELQLVHDFVESFQRGKISLAEFLAGPVEPAEDDGLLIVDALNELLADMEAERTTAPKRKRKRA